MAQTQKSNSTPCSSVASSLSSSSLSSSALSSSSLFANGSSSLTLNNSSSMSFSSLDSSPLSSQSESSLSLDSLIKQTQILLITKNKNNSSSLFSLSNSSSTSTLFEDDSDSDLTIESLDSSLKPLLPLRSALSKALSKPSLSDVFPHEIHQHIFSFMATSDLLTLRTLSHKFCALVAFELTSRLTSRLAHITKELAGSQDEYARLERAKRPHLRHYRNFLRGLSTNVSLTSSLKSYFFYIFNSLNVCRR
jgi:hypothetical protein